MPTIEMDELSPILLTSEQIRSNTAPAHRSVHQFVLRRIFCLSHRVLPMNDQGHSYQSKTITNNSVPQRSRTMVNFGRSKSTLNRVPFSQSPYQQSAAPPLPMNVRRRSVRV